MAHVVSFNLTGADDDGGSGGDVEKKQTKHEIGEEMGQGVSWISWGEVGRDGYDQNIFYNIKFLKIKTVYKAIQGSVRFAHSNATIRSCLKTSPY